MKRAFKVAALILAATTCAAFVPAFSGCSGETAYTLAEDDSGAKYYIASVTGFTKGVKGEVSIPAYYGEEGTENYAPVKEIAVSGFSGTDITKLTIPATVERIGAGAFAYMPSLNEVVFEEGIELEEIPRGCFAYSALSSIKVPAGVKQIGPLAFCQCASLSLVTLPEGVESIGAQAFENCAEIENINLPSTLISIGERCFYLCDSLEKIILPDGMHDTETVEEGKSDPTVIPAIGCAAFHSCTSLSLAVLGEGIATVGEGAFGSCTALETVYLPRSLKKVGGAKFKDNGDFYCGHAFHHDSALKYVYYAGSEEEWAAVDVVSETVDVKGENFDNSPLLNSSFTFNSPYKP